MPSEDCRNGSRLKAKDVIASHPQIGEQDRRARIPSFYRVTFYCVKSCSLKIVVVVASLKTFQGEALSKAAGQAYASFCCEAGHPMGLEASIIGTPIETFSLL